jgi:hypothetical protein
VQAVTSFYALIAAHRLSQALTLWSPTMRRAYDPAVNLYGRWDSSTRLTLDRIQPVSEHGNTAIVAVGGTDTTDGTTRNWSGTWTLRRTPDGWELDSPNLSSS